MRKFINLICLSALAISGGAPRLVADNTSVRAEQQIILHGKGTIEFQHIEGGFFGIIDEKGHRFDPVNLPKPFRKDGLEVTFTYIVCQRQVSFHMWGMLVEIVDIKAL